ncbi:MAG: hypothetical protein KDI12_09950, partial [Anaerolineae bacterium]|nr:hypothetical protein [Anaerolineae bacterium]
PLAVYIGDGQGNVISDVIGGLGLPGGRHVCYDLVFRDRTDGGGAVSLAVVDSQEAIRRSTPTSAHACSVSRRNLTACSITWVLAAKLAEHCMQPEVTEITQIAYLCG